MQGSQVGKDFYLFYEIYTTDGYTIATCIEKQDI